MGWSEADIPDQSGRVAIVTGANSGIGFETARALAQKGARVVLACRSAERGREAERRLREVAPEADTSFRPLDLGSLASVEAFAKEFAREASRLDLLINNAGVMVPPLGHTTDGFELQFGTNHLGHFALTGRLLAMLCETPGARVVTLSSTAHFVGRIDFDDLASDKGYVPMMAYGQSKVANLLFARELAHRLDGAGYDVVSAAAHPGSTRTELQRHSSLLNGFVAVISQSAPSGALPTLYAATASAVRGGDYYGPQRLFGTMGPPGPARSSLYSKRADVAARLWEVSERLTGVDYAL
jgi:NAD(P)-dependent dehydrogenase (short-subunit alcohol dehydrogenase family)